MLSVWDRVLISPSSRFYWANSHSNPANILGTIHYVGMTYVDVTRDTGGTNSYYFNDLVHANQQSNSTPIFLPVNPQDIMNINIGDVVFTSYSSRPYLVQSFELWDGTVTINDETFRTKHIQLIVPSKDKITFSKGDVIKSIEWYFSRILEITPDFYILSQRSKEENPGKSLETFCISTDVFAWMAEKFEYSHKDTKQITLTYDNITRIFWTIVRFHGDGQNIPRDKLKIGKKYYIQDSELNMSWTWYVLHKTKSMLIVDGDSSPIKHWCRYRIIQKKHYDTKTIVHSDSNIRDYKNKEDLLSNLPKIQGVEFLLP